MHNRVPGIIVIAYNRLHTVQRLLASLSRAHFPHHDIPLVISIDGGGDPAVPQFAQSFAWKNGPKKIIHHPGNLGLKKHILECGDLSEKFGAIIMLEDDVTVAPAFYDYSLQALQFFGADERIAGISLYNHTVNLEAHLNGIGLRFEAFQDGFDNWFAQMATSWGQCWTHSQWSSFRKWHQSTMGKPLSHRVPPTIKSWPDSSWKKHFNDYLVQNKKWFVYPRIALSTNWGDPGTHLLSQRMTDQLQTPMLFGARKWRFSSLKESLSRYDCFMEWDPVCLKKSGLLQDYHFDFDLQGLKPPEAVDQPFILTTRNVQPALFSFGIGLRPAECNVLAQTPGDGIRLVSRDAWVQSLEHFNPYPFDSVSEIWNRGAQHAMTQAIVEQQTQIDQLATTIRFFHRHPLRYVSGRLKSRIKARLRPRN